jgi:transcriptional regulator with XRE-family HTH domain
MAIGAVRLWRGMSQAQLASASGVSESTVSRYENGSVDPMAIPLHAIARALGVTSDFLLDPPPDRQAVLRALALDDLRPAGPAPDPRDVREAAAWGAAADSASRPQRRSRPGAGEPA